MYIGPLDHGYIFFWVYVSNGEKNLMLNYIVNMLS